MTNPENPSAAPVAWCRSDDFLNALLKQQSFSGWREQHPNCDMALYAQPQASAAPDAGQAEGPSLADVDELCAEFGFHVPDDEGRVCSKEVLRDMITAALARWRAPVAEPVATPATQEPDGDRVQKLAAIVREADPARLPRAWSHQFAQALLAHPGFSGYHDGPAAMPAQGKVGELIAALEADAECVAAEQLDLMQLTDKQLTRIAEILKAFNMGGWIVPTVEQTTPPASEVQGVAVDWYEFSVFDSDDQEMAGGDAATLSEVVAEGRHYLRQYNQDGPHKLELRRVLVLDHSEATDDHA